MGKLKIILFLFTVVLLGAVIYWLGKMPGQETVSATQAESRPELPVLRLGLVPERDIYQQRRAYRTLGDYLGEKLGCRIELVTNQSYVGVLDDFRAGKVDAAFLGSLVATLAIDWFDARVIAKPEYTNGVSSYRGVIFVPEESAITSLSELRGHTLGGVRTTLAGALFPIFKLREIGLLEGPEAPRLVWSGTHDDVIREVMGKKLDAGAVKNLRLNAYLGEHPGVRIRRLAESDAVPENALVVSKGMTEETVRKLTLTLLEMDQDARGRETLKALAMKRFLPCEIGEYDGLYGMAEGLGKDWAKLEVDGRAPQRKGTMSRPATAIGK